MTPLQNSSSGFGKWELWYVLKRLNKFHLKELSNIVMFSPRTEGVPCRYTSYMGTSDMKQPLIRGCTMKLFKIHGNLLCNGLNRLT